MREGIILAWLSKGTEETVAASLVPHFVCQLLILKALYNAAYPNRRMSTSVKSMSVYADEIATDDLG